MSSRFFYRNSDGTWNFGDPSGLRPKDGHFTGSLTVGGAINGPTSLDVEGPTTVTGKLSVDAAGSTTDPQLDLQGDTNNWMRWRNVGVSGPTFDTRSVGTKLVLWTGVTASTVDYALGVESGHMWFTAPEDLSSRGFTWYAGTSKLMALDGGSVGLYVRDDIFAGHTDPHPVLQGRNTNFASHGTGAGAGYSATRWSNDAIGSNFYLQKSRGAAVGTLGIVSNGDEIGTIIFAADDGTDLVTQAASIEAAVDGAAGANSVPGRLLFKVNSGVGGAAEALRISSDKSASFAGSVTVAGTFGAAAVSNTSGYFSVYAFNEASYGIGRMQSFYDANNTRWRLQARDSAEALQALEIEVFGSIKTYDGAQFGEKFGYSSTPVAAGGSVTQLTSKNTGVTLNKPVGRITMHAQSLAAGAIARFTLTNSTIEPDDVVIVHRIAAGTGGKYNCWCDFIAGGGGSCIINVKNEGAAALAEAVELIFMVFRGDS